MVSPRKPIGLNSFFLTNISTLSIEHISKSKPHFDVFDRDFLSDIFLDQASAVLVRRTPKSKFYRLSKLLKTKSNSIEHIRYLAKVYSQYNIGNVTLD